jgi:photosystem II stability/assembly factor-like uncharacterized protein
MALYDLTRIDWSNGTCNLDNIYYVGGFSNTLFFPEDLQAPAYEIEDDVKKADGLNNAKRQVWAKKLTLRIVHIEAVIDILSILPMHDTVTVTDKEGNAYTCAGADIVVDIQPEGEGETMGDRNRYPLMAVEITFNAHQIIKTGCCNTSIAAVSCSATLPTIDTVTEPIAGLMLITGTAPTGHQVRLFQRELFAQIEIEIESKINDVCWIDDMIAFSCTDTGNIYKTIDGGNAWTLSHNGTVQLNSIVSDGTVIFAGGEYDGVAHTKLLVSADFGLNWTTLEINNHGNIMSMDIYNINMLLMCTSIGEVILYDGTLNVYTLAGFLRDIAINKSNPDEWMVCGVNYIAFTSDFGGSWNTYVTTIDMICVVETAAAGKWIFGASGGKTYTTSDNGATIVSNVTFTDKCVGLTSRAYGGSLRHFAADINGNVKYSDDNGLIWSTAWKVKSVTSVNRIRANRSNDLKIMIAIGNGKVATTETGLDAVVPVILGSEYAGTGITYNAVNNVSYQLQVQSLTFTTDPCQNSTITIFTT